MRPAGLTFTTANADPMTRLGHWASAGGQRLKRLAMERPMLFAAPALGAVMALALGAASAFALRLPPEISNPDAPAEQAAAMGEVPSIEAATRNAADNPAAPPAVSDAALATDDQSASIAEDAQSRALDRQIARDMAAATPAADEGAPSLAADPKTAPAADADSTAAPAADADSGDEGA